MDCQSGVMCSTAAVAICSRSGRRTPAPAPPPPPAVGAGRVLARGLARAERRRRCDSPAADAWLARGSLLPQVDLQRARDAPRLTTVCDPQNADAFTLYGATLRDLGDNADGN